MRAKAPVSRDTPTFPAPLQNAEFIPCWRRIDSLLHWGLQTSGSTTGARAGKCAANDGPFRVAQIACMAQAFAPTPSTGGFQSRASWSPSNLRKSDEVQPAEIAQLDFRSTAYMGLTTHLGISMPVRRPSDHVTAAIRARITSPKL